MDLIVPVKAVPDADRIVHDPARRTVVRDGVDLFLNPFDLRALVVALDLRRPGERVVAVSMGPPSAARAPVEALALGADRAVLVSDPALAGSDATVTARVVARAIGQAGPGLVIAGARSTDAETGQVPPGLAGLLGVPFVGPARSLVREGGSLVVRVDRPDGSRTFRVPESAVVAVGEKIVKARKTDPAVLPSLLPRIERWTLAELDLPTESVGAAASPTEVAGLTAPAPVRLGRVEAEGEIPDRVERAVAVLAGRLPEAPRPLPVAPSSGPLRDAGEVLVVVTDEDGRLDLDALPLLTEVRRSLPGRWPTAVWVGALPDAPSRSHLARAGAEALRTVERSVAPSATELGRIVEGVLDARPAAELLLGVGGGIVRDALASVAARRSVGLIGDASSIRLAPGAAVTADKPTFGGSALAEVRGRTRPTFVTVSPGAFPGGEVPDPVGLTSEPIAVPSSDDGVVLLDRDLEPDPGGAALERARVVVAVGMGLGGPERLEALRPALEAWGAALAATRKVVDAGWVPRRLQVGLTGRAYAPDLVVLLGVRGSRNHLIGWRRAGAILAVTPDASAEVTTGSDVTIVGRWEEVLPWLTPALAPVAVRRRQDLPGASAPPP